MSTYKSGFARFGLLGFHVQRKKQYKVCYEGDRPPLKWGGEDEQNKGGKD